MAEWNVASFEGVLMDLTNKSELISYLKQHGLYTKKSLGQNFLVDRKVLNDIIDAANLHKDDTVVEVGAGLGVLTDELANSVSNVIAIELDNKLANLLKNRLPNINVVNDDVLNFNPATIALDDYKLIANIPYYITSKILRLFLENKKRPELIVLMTQKEVAERICAKPGQMSLLAVSVQAYGEPQIVRTVKSGSFFPAPDVDSAILRIASIKNKEYSIQGCEEKDFFKVVKAGFASKRKTLINNLNAGTEFNKEEIAGIIKAADLNENVRAQELNIEQWGTLCQKLQKLRKN